MISNNDKVSSGEVGVFIFLTVVGMGVLALPSKLAQDVDNDAWVLSIAAGLISILLLFVICKIGERHGRLGFVETLRYLFGNILGTILAIPVAVYGIIVTAIELRLFAEITKIYLLHKTPLEFIILPAIVLTVLLVRMGIEPITRSFGIFIFIVAFVAIILVIAGLPHTNLSNLMPLLTKPVDKYLFGMFSFTFAYVGFEVMLIMYPKIQEPRKAFKAAATAMALVTVFYTIVTIQCITGLGTEETKSLLYPVMALTKSISIPGGFVENVEGLLNALWVIYAITTLVGFLYFFSVVSAGIMRHREHKHFASLSIPIIYLISLQGSSMTEVFELTDVAMRYLGTYTIVLLPVLMLIFSYIRGGKARN